MPFLNIELDANSYIVERNFNFIRKPYSNAHYFNNLRQCSRSTFTLNNFWCITLDAPQGRRQRAMSSIKLWTSNACANLYFWCEIFITLVNHILLGNQIKLAIGTLFTANKVFKDGN